MAKLVTGRQYCLKHLVRGNLISTCFLKLKLQDYQNFMEDLIHSPENSILGKNILEPHCSYAGLGRTPTQEPVLQQVNINFKSKTFLLTDLNVAVSIRASYRESDNY